MLGSVKHLLKKERGVKEALAVMVIVGNTGSRISLLKKEWLLETVKNRRL